MTFDQTKCIYCGKAFRTIRGAHAHEDRWCVQGGCPICEGGFGRPCDWHFA